ncbi:HAD-IIB family hydrolase [Lysinibacillus sphaericus]|uniref:HAD-IIB family hydrolase n=1 Tax=Lysinibacillus sphaericus TaxID=1421 RepID=UPI001910C4E6|nr:HAD-IIB family hydrolase [Lysinibacillus sphaericus]QPA52723.1 HAD-IIB family hydrolase [Lysinibacillus sphaericus]
MYINDILTNNHIKFAAFDLDGTLLNEQGKLIRDVHNGLHNLVCQGIVPFIVTGRSLDSFLSLELSDEFLSLFNENILCSDGNILFNREKKEIKVYSSLKRELLYFIDDYYKNQAEYIVEVDGIHYATSKEAVLKYSMVFSTKRNKIKLLDLQTLNFNSLTEIIIFPHKKTSEISLPLYIKPWCNTQHMKYFNSTILLPRDICKATGLVNFLKEEFGNQNLNHVIAFGDGRNDTTLLKESKIGIAMNISHEEAIANCDIHLDVSIGEFLNKTLHV